MTETRTISIREALNEALAEALRDDPSVFLLGEDLADPAAGVNAVTRGLATEFGSDRVMNTPISEAAIIGAAVGAAIEGYKPVAEIMIMDFIGIAMDQMVNHAAKIRYMSGGRTTCPITVRTAVFAGTGSGGTHSQSLEAWFMHVPGMKVVYPSNPADAKGLLLSAIFDPDPVLFIEASRLYGVKGEVPVGDGHRVPIGKAAIIRPGTDLTIITYGLATASAVQAAERLAEEGVDAEVIDLRTLLPLDMDTVLESVGRTRRAIIAHNATTVAGPGAEIAAQISAKLFGVLAEPVQRVGARFTPIPARASEFAVTLSVDGIVDAAKQTIGAVRV
ncbi:pyruvate dehydrogenase E1 component beta subunit [Microbacterium terrae]|uniref:Acetoin:2,6-dichlorophenolindophenol oxidoreductase subunit beta n=1 Tax=Microbacterium terrae TaxID=69369 RepID=A0A0M2HI76_9MICO|nr:pyruvate dehydrogenase complex E1 component subunit beta [Microbacterium terrae]KJL44009.1 Acetoin:2,6-dichlorophenolindophenol oxidoreductase subunit beta [Microbacterium terrae]MBP1079457.1 pyruvate dehydrogenase E1 component beta subunit [Microbacterium terrae]GLJ98858.1 pyruvate dehydrogenase subunit beta [Microbacterium terrae]